MTEIPFSDFLQGIRASGMKAAKIITNILQFSRMSESQFYTTKPVGEGTGLGPSVACMIITNHHGGTIEVVSEPEKGAAFIIRLPLQRPDS